MTPELLAPAGGWDALRAAISGGANAVYLGLKSFSARSYAQNFSDQELFEVVCFAHMHNVKVYLAANTLVHPNELGEYQQLVKTACRCGVDAIIVQDLGAMAVIRRMCAIPIHASTQMAAYNLAGVERLGRLGAKRVVLARELDHNRILHISQRTSLELEIFVHGALCCGYSGLCLFSSMLGGRSGNRGQCAQPCRLEYTINNKRGRFLNMADNCLLPYLNQVAALGVTSLKIEGRMKSADYVYTTTKAYKNSLLTKKASKEDEQRLKSAFCRGNAFTAGYFTNKLQGMTVVCDSGKRVHSAVQTIPAPNKLALDMKLSVGDSVSLSVTAQNRTAIASAAENCSMASRIPPQRIQECLTKTGPEMHVRKLEIGGVGVRMKISQLNNLRRTAVAALRESFAPPLECVDIDVTAPMAEQRQSRLAAVVLNAEQMDAALEGGADFVYAPPQLMGNGVYLQPVIGDEHLRRLEDCRRPIMVNNIGSAAFPAMHGGMHLNVTNHLSAHEYASLGMSRITLSPELGLAQMRDIAAVSPCPCDCIAYGRLPLLFTATAHLGKTHSITDRKGRRMSIIHFGQGISAIYNAHPIYMADKTDKMDQLRQWGIGVILYFTVETSEQTKAIVRQYATGEGVLPRNYRRI